MHNVYYIWPLGLAIGLAIFALSFVIPEPNAATALRVVSVICFGIAAIFAIPGIA